MARIRRPGARLGAATLALCLLSAGACREADRPPASAGAVPARPAQGGTAVIAASADIGGVHQLLSATDAFTQSVLDLLFLRLFEEQPDFDQHPPTFTPELAESWDWSDDRRLLILRLRQDIVWSDGSPVTAADVEWTWLAQTQPDVAWSYADSKDNILSVEALDSHSVQVTFRRPNDAQLADLNEGVILPRHAWSALPFDKWRESADWFLDHLVTNGPFELESWDRQQQIILRRSELLPPDRRPYLDRVVFRIVPQKVNQVGQLLAGDLHFVEQIPPADAATVASADRAELVAYWPRQYNFVSWNTARPLFASAEARQAMTMAIDRQELVDALWLGHARVATSPIISSVWAHHGGLEPWPYDPERARRQLAGLGWHDTDGDGILDRGGVPFSFELVTNANSTVRVDAAVMIQAQLRRAGIDARVRRLEFNTLISRCTEHDFDAMLGGWNIDTTLDLYYQFHSQASEKGYNFGSFADPRIDRLIDQARSQIETGTKGEILQRIQELLHEQQPYTFLWEPQRLTGVAKTLRDARPNALDPYFRLERWWLAPPG